MGDCEVFYITVQEKSIAKRTAMAQYRPMMKYQRLVRSFCGTATISRPRGRNMIRVVRATEAQLYATLRTILALLQS